jgi:hypothetical protein
MRPDRLAAVTGVQAIAFVGAGDEEAERLNERSASTRD